MAAFDHLNQSANSYTMINATSASGSGYYPQQYPQTYVPPANWASFPCGHQMKLEQGQPYPTRCQVCPPPEHAHHEYKKCGHIHNYEKGQQIPAECPTCVNQRWQAEAAAKARAEEIAADAERRALEDKDPIAWLDKQILSVREVAFA